MMLAGSAGRAGLGGRAGQGGNAGLGGNTRKPAFLVFAVLCGPLGAGLLAALSATGLVTAPAIGGVFTYLLMALIVAPLLEEMAFRGAIQELLADQPWARASWAGVSIANAATSAVFALCHVPTQATALALATFLPSLLLGKLREQSGSVAACVGLHAWFNLCCGLAFFNWR